MIYTFNPAVCPVPSQSLDKCSGCRKKKSPRGKQGFSKPKVSTIKIYKHLGETVATKQTHQTQELGLMPYSKKKKEKQSKQELKITKKIEGKKVIYQTITV